MKDLSIPTDAALLNETAGAIIERVLAESQAVERQISEGAESRTGVLLDTLRFTVKFEEGCTIIKAYILSIFKGFWDTRIPDEFKNKYDGSFDTFVFRETGLVGETVDNYMRAADVFIRREFQPFVSVEVVDRDEFGRPKRDAAGNPKMRTVDWDPTKTSISKLVLAAPLARSGDLQNNPKILSLLMDEKATIGDLKTEIYGGREEDKPDYHIRFRIEGANLVAHRNGESADIAELDFGAYEENDLARDAIHRLCSILDANLDTNVIMQQAERGKRNDEFEEAYQAI